MPSWLTNSGPRLPTGVEDLQPAEASHKQIRLRNDEDLFVRGQRSLLA
jgi:hypothetical protein